MVLPPPPPDDAPRAVEPRWFDTLKFALRLSKSGLLLLVDHARQESLGELVEALVPEHPELDVHTDVRRMLEVPHGSTVVLVPRVEDADWLNINRPLFAQRELRVILFCDTQTTIALAQRAVDFFDWISHRVDCPQRPPRFAVERIRTALAVRAPGIVWTGGDLQAAFTAARPHGRLHEVSAALPYPEMVEEIRQNRRAWIAWKNVDGHFHLRRVRWALAEARHWTRSILVKPKVTSPGWWTIDGRMMDVRAAREQIDQAGVSFPGRMAAILDFSPEALAQLNKIKRIPRDETLDRPQAFKGTTVPWDLPPTRLRQLCLQEFSRLNERIVEKQFIEPEEAASWAAWFPSFRRAIELAEASWIPLGKAHRPSAMEFILARLPDEPLGFINLLQFAVQIDAAVVEHWLQLVADGLPNEQPLQLLMKMMKEAPYSEESFLREELRATAPDSPLRDALVFALTQQMGQHKKWQETEGLLREELVRMSLSSPANSPMKKRFSRNLAESLREQGKYSEAETVIRQAIAEAVGESDEERINLGLQLDEWASLLISTRRAAEAESALKRSFILLSDTLGVERLDTTRVMTKLASLLRREGRLQEAEDQLRQALSKLGEQQGDGGQAHAELLHSLSLVLSDLGKYAEAESLLIKAIQLRETLRIGKSEDIELMRYKLATVLIAQGRYAESEQLLRQLISLNSHDPALRLNLLRPALFHYGHLLWIQNRAAEAEPYLVRALKILGENSSQANPLTFQHLGVLANVQAEIDSPHAQSTAREALSLLEQNPKLTDSFAQDLIDGLKAIAQPPMDPSPS